MTKLFCGSIVVAALAFGAGTANAASLCVPGGTNADGLSVDEVSLEGVDATNCYGTVTGNTSNNDINTQDGGVMLFGGTNWNSEIKDDGASVNVFGLDWTVTATVGTTGTWNLSFVDSVPSALSFTSDILVALKAGNEYAVYYFDDFLFDETSNDGEYKISFLNNGGQTPDLSHMSVYLRDFQEVPDCVPGTPGCPNPRDVPEPTSMLLLGLGMLGAGFARRRK